MKIIRTPHRRAFAALLPATLVLAAPATAQEATPAPPIATTITPPPVVSTVPATAAGSPRAAPDGIGDPNSSTPIAPEAIAQAEESRAARVGAAPRVARRAPRAVAVRATPVAAAPVTAPIQAAPTPAAVAPAPIATPAPVVDTPAAPAPAAPATDSATTDTTTTTEAAPIWPWVVGGLVVLGAVLAFFLRRRSRIEEYDAVYEEPVVHAASEPIAAVTPEPVSPVAVPVARQTQTSGATGRLQPQFLGTAPLAAAPVVAADVSTDSVVEGGEGVAAEAELVEPEAGEVAALTAGTAHADRPWLEFALRPVRAGSNADDAVVEIELTVANSGGRAAQDVRISTMLFADGPASEIVADPVLADRSAGDVTPVTIEPGDGTRVDATLLLSKAQIGEEARTFNPVIVADARYTLPDGSQGRTSAAFTIGLIGANGDADGAGEAGEAPALRGIAIHRPQMSDDIEARLYGTPQHA